MEPTSLTTERLRLRPWRDSDLAAFAAMSADPVVMQYFPRVLDRAQSDAVAARIRRHIDMYGWGFWALEVRGITEFAGIVGLMNVPITAHFTPAVEIGWRLAPGAVATPLKRRAPRSPSVSSAWVSMRSSLTPL